MTLLSSGHHLGILGGGGGEFSSRRTMADSFDLPCVQKLLPFFHVIVHYPESEHLLLNPRRRHLVHVSGHPKLLRMLR